MLSEPSVVFVRGCARSGTTLLSDVMNESPEIGILVEQPLGDVAYRMLDLFWFDDHRQWQKAAIAANTKSSRKNSHFVPTLNDDRVRFSLRYPTRERFPQILTSVVETSLDKPDLKIIGSKTPGHWNDHELKIVSEMYQSVKYVFIVRNPRDTVNSIVNRRNAARDGLDLWPDKPMWEAISRYHEGICLLLSCARDNPETTFVVGYDDLVNAPDATLQSLGRFLGVELRDFSGIVKQTSAAKSVLAPGEERTLEAAVGLADRAWSNKHLTGNAPEVVGQLHDCVRTVEVGKQYRCDAPFGDRGLLGSGWSGAEPPGIWSDSEVADVWFAVPEDGYYAVDVSYAVSGSYFRQPLQLRATLEDQSVETTVRSGKRHRLRLSARLKQGAAHRLHFEFHNLPAFTLRERTKDPRRKAICLRRLTVKPA